MSYMQLLENIKNKYAQKTIKSEDINFLKPLLNKDTVLLLIKNILSNDYLLNTISNRSYRHALGFDKIVLMDLSKDCSEKYHKAQLRLHIWDPQTVNSLPIVESLHEHSFDFVSTILTGHLENQQFSFAPLNSYQKELFIQLQKIILNLNKEDLIFLNEQIEIIEAIKLAQLGSKQLTCMNLLKNYNLEKIKKLTNFSENDIFELTAIEGHYVSNRITGERKSYKHILKEYVSIIPHDVLSLNAGDYYFHPHELPHRLYYDNTILNSTILITTPVAHNQEGGSLQRPTYIQNNEQSYNKIIFTQESLKTTLTNYYYKLASF